MMKLVSNRDEIASFIAYTKELEVEYSVRICIFGHAGDGNMHVFISSKDDLEPALWKEKMEIIMDLLYVWRIRFENYFVRGGKKVAPTS